MSSEKQNSDAVARISIYNIDITHIQLTPSDMKLKTHTGYDDEHLKRLKYLFQQILDSKQDNLDEKHFELAVRSICHSLTQSNQAHRLAERLFKAYDKNTDGSIDFPEMIDFVWTISDAPREEQIVGLYQALKDSNGKLSKTSLIEFLIVLKDDFQSDISLNTDDDIRNRVDECFAYYHNPSDGVHLNQILDYFLGSRTSLTQQIKQRWIDRIQRHKNRKNKESSFQFS